MTPFVFKLAIIHHLHLVKAWRDLEACGAALLYDLRPVRRGYAVLAPGNPGQGVRLMSDRQANEEAKRRFGADGVAWHHPQSRPGDFWWCCVGLRLGDCMNDWKILGKGTTWEKAFAACPRRKK